jgi:Flp pilus assembly protein TadD
MSAGGALTLPPELEERIERLGLEFLAELLGRSLVLHPDRFDALVEYATVLTRLGRLEEGLEADRRLVALAPDDPTVHYNLACSLALVGQDSAALDELERAVTLGYRDAEHLLVDEDLAVLRGSPRFARLFAELERLA